MTQTEPAARHAGPSRLLEASRKSAVAQLVLLVAVFVALPILVSGLMKAIDAERHQVRMQTVAAQAALVEAALTPLLERASPAEAESLAGQLARLESDGMSLKLFFRPPATADSAAMFFIASGTALGDEELQTETARLRETGVFQRLIDRCRDAGSADTIVTLQSASATTATRVRSADGCWGIVAGFTVPAPAPLWSSRSLQIAGIVYAVIVLIALWNALRLVVNLGRARDADALAGMVFPQRVEPVMLTAAPQPPATAVPEPPAAAVPEPPAAAVPEPPAAVPPEALAATPSEPVVALNEHREPPAPAEGEEAQSADPFDLRGAGGLLDETREIINLSRIVNTYLAGETGKLGAQSGRLQSEIESDIVMRGRADFVATILNEVVGGALRDGGEVRVTLGGVRDESRRRALLSIVQTGGVFPELGRLPLIKQFVAALGAVSAESRDEGAATVRLAFPA